MSDMSFDVVCVGAGNKNLAFGCWATKYGGLSVAMFDERHEAGAGWSSEESPAPGFIADHCSHIHGAGMHHGLLFEDFPEAAEMAESSTHPVFAAMVFEEDDTWIGRYSFGEDPTQEKTAKMIARYSQKDAETYLWLCEKMGKYWAPALFEAAWNPTKDFDEPDAIDTLIQNPESGFKPEWQSMTPIQVVSELFESTEVQVMFLRVGQSSGPQPDEPGTALLSMATFMQPDIMVHRGGAHNMTHICTRIIQRNGGKISLNSRVEKILIENGKATGVRLADGTEIEAKLAVVCGSNAQDLVLELTGPEHWSPTIVEKIKKLHSHMNCISWYTWALQEQPRYRAEVFNPDCHMAAYVCLGRKDIDYVLDDVIRRRKGLWPDPEKFNLVINNWSIADPTLAPPGKACALTEQYVLPATAYNDQEWKEIEKRHADEIIRFWGKYAPNVNWDNVIGYVPVTPYFTVKHSRSYAPSGAWTSINVSADQMGKNRPIPELSNIRKFPIKNLYPASSCWGGYVVGATCHQGYHVYKVLADLHGLRKPWEDKGRPF
jgi:phytoene dehydrogenase-like protein